MKKIIILILIFILGQQIFAQEYPIKSEINSNSQNTVAYEILEEIEMGISKTKLSAISPHLSSHIYISFLNGVSSYYSSNQAYYVLENFFKEYNVISFKFDSFNFNTVIPFAKGTYYYEHKGNRSEAKVYLTMKLTGESWKITQISIN
ncbi:MAG: DUF4783 domain-containing protein [Ignavibacteriaceae bacterium]